MESLCVKAGMTKVILEVYKDTPCDAIVRKSAYSELSLLCNVLVATNSVGIGRPDSEYLGLLRQALEFGCNPNWPVSYWPKAQSQRWLLEDNPLEDNPLEDDSLQQDHPLVWCKRTMWQAWLVEAAVQFRHHADERLGLNEAITLLLQYGADPHCTLCLTNHELEPYDGNNCVCVPLLGMFECITSACTLEDLKDLLLQCSREMTVYRLRRNQLRRALRSLSLSVGFEEWRYTRFFGYLTGETHGKCSRCSADSRIGCLTTWCIDCQQTSDVCHRCLQIDIPGTTVYEESCQASAGISGIAADDHTVVAFVYRCGKDLDPDIDGPELELLDHLALRYDPAKAIDSLKAWYAKDPIDPNLSFEEAIRNSIFPSIHGVMQESGVKHGRTLTQQRTTSDRPWLL
jgi:hypothetical protein